MFCNKNRIIIGEIGFSTVFIEHIEHTSGLINSNKNYMIMLSFIIKKTQMQRMYNIFFFIIKN